MIRPVKHLEPDLQKRERMCGKKHRYSDEIAARAGGMVRLEKTTDGITKLYTYRCKLCYGWHLTCNERGKGEAITLQMEVVA